VFPKNWKPWRKNRKKFRWRFGDPTGDLFEARYDYACYVHSERLTILHPTLRKAEYHDLYWDTKGHEMLHAIFPSLGHGTINRIERVAGQFLHDLQGCGRCNNP
jgi:hypothetical protein